MAVPPVVPRRAVIVAAIGLVVLILLAAVANVPWALTRMQSRDGQRFVPMAPLEGSAIPHDWPVQTPHSTPWPRPDYWFEGGIFG